MSETETITTLEFLPNEIVLQCFRYLNALHLFYSFDQLNDRFNTLIRSLSLHVDFQDVSSLICSQFCKKMVHDQDMKNQIFSLHLSNVDKYSDSIISPHVFIK